MHEAGHKSGDERSVPIEWHKCSCHGIALPKRQGKLWRTLFEIAARVGIEAVIVLHAHVSYHVLNMEACVCVYMYVCVYRCTLTQLHMFTRIRSYPHTQMHTHADVDTCTHIPAYIHTYIHTYMQTGRQTDRQADT